MPSKSFSALVFLLALTSSVNAGAAVSPALGVKGEPVSGDVRTPSIPGDSCGGVDIVANIDTSRIVRVGLDGILSVDILNFDLGVDGSRFIKTVGIDPSGTGKDLVAAKVNTNGDPAPANLGRQTITVQLPVGLECKGGRGANLCVAAFITTSNFGNCLVFTQADVNTDDDGEGGQSNPEGITVGKREPVNVDIGVDPGAIVDGVKQGVKVAGTRRESVDVDGKVTAHRRGIERRRSSYRNGNI